MADKAELIAAFHQRVKRGKTETKINNADLHAGSPMHYNCDACRCQDIVVGEGWTEKPNLCHACDNLKQLGWLNEALGKPDLTGEHADLIRRLSRLGVINEKWKPDVAGYFSHTGGRISLSEAEKFFNKAVALSREAAAALKALTGQPPEAS